MKTLIIILLPITIWSQSNFLDNKHPITDEDTRLFITNYVKDLNEPDWELRIEPYLFDIQFIEEHRSFRESFTDYSFSIKYLTTDGNKGIVWGTVKANFSKELKQGIFEGVAPTNKPVEWDEIWYFTIENGRFAAEGDFLQNHFQLMQSIGINYGELLDK